MQRVVDAEEGHVVLDRPLVGEPEQGSPVVAEHLVHLAVGRLRPHRHGADPVGAPFITFFCMNGAAPGRTRWIVNGRPASRGTIRSEKASR